MKNLKKAIFFSALLATFSVWANVEQTRNVTVLKDVETLNDNLAKYSGKVVRVNGEIEEKIDSRSIVLESGGFLNDEIVVINGANAKGTKIDELNKDTKVVVTGTVVMKPVSEFRKDYNWNLNSETEKEFKNIRAFLVAEEITTVLK